MSMELAQLSDDDERREGAILWVGGIMVLVGAGLLLWKPRVRKYLRDIGIERRLRAALPELERYIRLR